MNKGELIEALSDQTGESKALTRKVLEKFLEEIGNSLAAGNNIELRGFGSFKVKKRKAQKARNPRTGEEVDVPSRFVPTFKPSRNLQKKVADS